MIKLLPCPFCGGKAKCTSIESGMRATAIVFCTSCGVELHGPSFHIYYHCKGPELRSFRNEAREKWNKRV